MNTAGKIRSLLDMSRKQSKFIPEDWVDIGRYRLSESEIPVPHIAAGSGLYSPSSLPPLAWNLVWPRDRVVNPRHSTAMKREREAHTLPIPKTPKTDRYNFPRMSQPFAGYQNTSTANVGTFFTNASTGNLLQDISQPSYDMTFMQHYHHYPNHFNDKRHGTSAIDAPRASHFSSASQSSSSAHQSEMIERCQLHREWQMIESPTVDGSIVRPIRIVSYNILSQKLLELNKYLYRKCDPNILNWAYRWGKLQEEIQELRADILCLQEVEEYHFDHDISKFLGRNNYKCHYKRRTGNNRNKPDGVLIAFKKDKFQLLESRKVEYRRGNQPPVNQDNVAVITVLKPCGGTRMPQDSCICVVNTHLLYNPKRGDIKLAQLSTLFAEVHDIISSQNASDVPVLMCGDFNSVPNSSLFNFITRQELNYTGIACKYVSGQKVGSQGKNVLLPEYLLPQHLGISCEGCVKVTEANPWNGSGFHLSHSLGSLLSSYCHDERQATTTQEKGVTVDYIFHTPYNDSAFSLRPNKRLSLVSPRSLAAVGGIPNAVHPSDHLPVVVDFDLLIRKRIRHETD